jgi:heat shock protein HslJ
VGSKLPTLRTLAVSFLLLVNACTTQTATQGNEPMNDNPGLQGTSWWVEDIAGKGVIDMSHTTIEFTEDGKLAGDTGCNRYFGSYELVGKTIRFGPLAGTRKACAESLMNQEMVFYQAMEKVSHWEIAETGLLHLRDEAATSLIRASKVE